jgi:hypothetical protein
VRRGWVRERMGVPGVRVDHRAVMLGDGHVRHERDEHEQRDAADRTIAEFRPDSLWGLLNQSANEAPIGRVTM